MLPAPVFLAEEDSNQYYSLVARIEAAVGPRDVIEAILVRDFVDLAWEVTRLRRLKTRLLRAKSRDGLRSVLESLVGDRTAADIIRELGAGSVTARKNVDQFLSGAQLDHQDVEAATLARHIGSIERIDRLIESHERRRASMLHEIQRHRASLGAKLDTAIQDAEYAEFSVSTERDPSHEVSRDRE